MLHSVEFCFQTSCHESRKAAADTAADVPVDCLQCQCQFTAALPTIACFIFPASSWSSCLIASHNIAELNHLHVAFNSAQTAPVSITAHTSPRRNSLVLHMWSLQQQADMPPAHGPAWQTAPPHPVEVRRPSMHIAGTLLSDQAGESINEKMLTLPSLHAPQQLPTAHFLLRKVASLPPCTAVLSLNSVCLG